MPCNYELEMRKLEVEEKRIDMEKKRMELEHERRVMCIELLKDKFDMDIEAAVKFIETLI